MSFNKNIAKALGVLFMMIIFIFGIHHESKAQYNYRKHKRNTFFSKKKKYLSFGVRTGVGIHPEFVDYASTGYPFYLEAFITKRFNRRIELEGYMGAQVLETIYQMDEIETLDKKTGMFNIGVETSITLLSNEYAHYHRHPINFDITVGGEYVYIPTILLDVGYTQWAEYTTRQYLLNVPVGCSLTWKINPAWDLQLKARYHMIMMNDHVYKATPVFLDEDRRLGVHDPDISETAFLGIPAYTTVTIGFRHIFNNPLKIPKLLR